MAGADEQKPDSTEATHEPRECMACRGTGRVISNLGGSPSTVPCPWCEGSGLRASEIDAQAHWGPREGAEESQPEQAAAEGESS